MSRDIERGSVAAPRPPSPPPAGSPSGAAPQAVRPSNLVSVSKRLQLEQLQRSQWHSPRPEPSEFPSVDVAAPGRTIDVGGRQYRCGLRPIPL